jgi:hypothetical protein
VPEGERLDYAAELAADPAGVADSLASEASFYLDFASLCAPGAAAAAATAAVVASGAARAGAALAAAALAGLALV